MQVLKKCSNSPKQSTSKKHVCCNFAAQLNTRERLQTNSSFSYQTHTHLPTSLTKGDWLLTLSHPIESHQWEQETRTHTRKNAARISAINKTNKQTAVLLAVTHLCVELVGYRAMAPKTTDFMNCNRLLQLTWNSQLHATRGNKNRLIAAATSRE